MKIFFVISILLMLTACSQEEAEEFVFKKTMAYQLKDGCGDNEECITAIEDQMEFCMDQSEWRKYLENPDDEEELNRFIKSFFPCFKDPDGNSYF